MGRERRLIGIWVLSLLREVFEGRCLEFGGKCGQEGLFE